MHFTSILNNCNADVKSISKWRSKYFMGKVKQQFFWMKINLSDSPWKVVIKVNGRWLRTWTKLAHKIHVDKGAAVTKGLLMTDLLFYTKQIRLFFNINGWRALQQYINIFMWRRIVIECFVCLSRPLCMFLLNFLAFFAFAVFSL